MPTKTDQDKRAEDKATEQATRTRAIRRTKTNLNLALDWIGKARASIDSAGLPAREAERLARAERLAKETLRTLIEKDSRT